MLKKLVLSIVLIISLSIPSFAQVSSVSGLNVDGTGQFAWAMNVKGIAEYSNNLATAVASIGSVTPTTLIIDRNINLGASVDSTPNILLFFTTEGGITQTGAYTLKIGKMNHVYWKIFYGFSSGQVTFSSGATPAAYAEMWGVTGTNDEIPINCAANSGAAITQLLDTTYWTKDDISLPSNTTLQGEGWNTKIKYNGLTPTTANGKCLWMIRNSNADAGGGNTNIHIKDLYASMEQTSRVVGQGGSKTKKNITNFIILFEDAVTNSSIENVYVTKSGQIGIGVGDDCSGISVINSFAVGNYQEGLVVYPIGIGAGHLPSKSFISNNYIKGNGAGAGFPCGDVILNGTKITMTSNYVETIQTTGTGACISVGDDGIAGVGHNVISNNVLIGPTAAGASGIQLLQYASENSITGNYIYGVLEGILVAGGAGNVPSYNDISGNVISTTTGDGIVLDEAYYNTVVGNNLNAIGTIGISIGPSVASAGNTISGNSIYWTGSGGIYLKAGENNVISGNRVSHTGKTVTTSAVIQVDSNTNSVSNNHAAYGAADGILLNGSYTLMNGNDVYDNSLNGINLVASSYNTITGNHVTDNNLSNTASTNGITLSSTSTYNTVTGNVCVKKSGGHEKYGIDEQTSSNYNIMTNNILNGSSGGVNKIGANSIVTGANITY